MSKNIVYVAVGVLWFIFGLLITVKMSSWFTTIGTAISDTLTYSTFPLVLYWVSLVSITTLLVIILPLVIIMKGFGDNEGENVNE